MPPPPPAWTIPGADGQPIFGRTDLPPAAVTCAGTLVLCHGFKGYMDYGFFPLLARSAAARGLAAHRFNFSHSGVTPHFATFERPDLFERDTWLKQVHDLAAVAAARAAGRLPGPSSGPLVVFGHSRGGVTALLAAAASQPGFFAPLRGSSHLQARPAPPTAVVTAAAPDTCCSLDASERQRLRRSGYLPSPSSRTGQNLRIGRAWLDEVEAWPEHLDPLAAAAHLPCPLLVLHGAADETVPVAAAGRLAQAAGARARVCIIPGASHTFDAPNPLAEDAAPPPNTLAMVEAVCSFAWEQCGQRS